MYKEFIILIIMILFNSVKSDDDEVPEFLKFDVDKVKGQWIQPVINFAGEITMSSFSTFNLTIRKESEVLIEYFAPKIKLLHGIVMKEEPLTILLSPKTDKMMLEFQPIEVDYDRYAILASYQCPLDSQGKMGYPYILLWVRNRSEITPIIAEKIAKYRHLFRNKYIICSFFE